ncbi:MAG: TetR/AcrR family transcriptional regulator [Proteobacteria bacterium]|nr:TetR/AcrR family transcriptional regulator [Pseudomonadota bacterium]MBU1584722.1 TetR/AcrR family transcriptional regulator [Pseudomonadota bacterium]MBU2451975.1 TetR/AcrR family transcriptional regulator [Pseudomonadota bacterium]MBU2628883.1 TetR/AcrR family transcriptional regulator [Pseudomonadota bacterium]
MEQPKANRREVQKAETRTLILESARKLFENQEYDKVTIRGVAGLARIGLGTIYKHFPNKLSMLAAAFSDDLKNLYQDAMATMPDNQSFQTQFIHISKRFFIFYITHYSLSRAYLSHLFFYERKWLDEINTFDDNYAQKMAELIRAAQGRGEINPEKDSHILALALMSNYFFVLANCFLREKMTDPDQLAALLETLVEQTLL